MTTAAAHNGVEDPPMRVFVAGATGAVGQMDGHGASAAQCR
jgi:hypothetical protein